MEDQNLANFNNCSRIELDDQQNLSNFHLNQSSLDEGGFQLPPRQAEQAKNSPLKKGPRIGEISNLQFMLQNSKDSSGDQIMSSSFLQEDLSLIKPELSQIETDNYFSNNN